MTKRINLALQGGGAHGAFSWGVLDRLLEDERIEIAAISGTSAGALNGAALKCGWARDGRDGARACLSWFWAQVGAIEDPAITPWLSLTPPSAMRMAIEMSPGYLAADLVGRVTSPYGLGPLYTNPLDRIVRQFDYGGVCADQGPAFHVCATNVRTGKIRIFERDAITPEALMASACLPAMFKAVEIEDPATGRAEAYWDGGYTGNPALFPLYPQDLPRDIVVVNINPLYREDLPKTAMEIQNRVNEISFNSSLLQELRAINFVKRLIAEGSVTANSMKDALVHMIADDALMRQLSVGTKLVPTPQVLHALKHDGRTACAAFLDAHFDDLGERSSVDLVKMFS